MKNFNYIKNIKYILNNENGAAGIEEFIGIGIAIIASVGVYVLAKNIRESIHLTADEVPQVTLAK